MKITPTISKIIKESIEEIKQETGYEFEYRDAKETVNRYFAVVARLISRGDRDDAYSFINRIEVAGLGFFRFNKNVIKRKLVGKLTKTIDHDFAHSCKTYIEDRGWKYLDWFQDRGYVFVHEDTNHIYDLTNKTVETLQDAYIHFSEIVDTTYVWENIYVNICDPFEERVPLTCRGYSSFTKEGKLIRHYDTLEEIAEDTNTTADTLLWLILRNDKKFPDQLVAFKNRILTFRNDKYKGKRRLIFGGVVIHDFPIDILDAKTREVIYSRFGTAADIANFIRGLKKYKTVKTSPILRVLDKDKQMYGFKFKRSI